MNDDIEILKKRFCELAAKSYNGGYFTFTDFLGLPEQSAFAEVLPKLNAYKHTSFGGVVGAERIVVRFGDPEEMGYDPPFPILCVKITPPQQKFADKLTHRDFLGALLNLGIERSTLGDIVICDNVGYVFALEDMAKFITGELSRVKRTDVRAMIVTELPSSELYRTEEKRIQISSERIDAIISKVYNLSRDESSSLFKRKLVYVNGRLCENNSYNPKPEEKISVRGFGRFIYLGYDSLSRKGKLNAMVKIYT